MPALDAPPPRLAVLADYPDEGWASMDLCAEMLLAHLPRAGAAAVAPGRVCPPFRRLATRLPAAGRRAAAFNADRLWNRYVAYPRHARRIASDYDLFHLVDHSYSQLLHALPAGRAGVYCHDLDTFRCLVEPAADPRPRWFRALARRTLAGMRRAAVVFHNSLQTREQLLGHGLIDPAKLVHAPLGVAAEFTPAAGDAPPPWLAPVAGRPWVLHVGSNIPRKRIDVLLDVVAAVRRAVPDLMLVKVGGDSSAAHREQVDRLGLAGTVVHARDVSRAELAEAYRRATAVLMPSSAEGFGLPVVEALACGAAVVASDIPALREAGGPAAVYCPVAATEAWTDVVRRIVGGEPVASPLSERMAWAARFSWRAHAATVAAAYRRLWEA